MTLSNGKSSCGLPAHISGRPTMNIKCDNIAVSVGTSEYQSATLLPTDNEVRSGSLQRSGLAESKQISYHLQYVYTIT